MGGALNLQLCLTHVENENIRILNYKYCRYIPGPNNKTHHTPEGRYKIFDCILRRFWTLCITNISTLLLGADEYFEIFTRMQLAV